MKSTTATESQETKVRERHRPAHAPELHEAPRFGAMFVPNATAFIASGCIMVVEILSGRLVSPYLGASLYTWTSAIGVVLAGISIGNYVGGRLADRFHIRRTLSVLFLLASVCCILVPAVNGAFGRWQALPGLTWPQRIFLHFVVAFLPPAAMLGTIGPVVAKMALNMGRATGRTIGTIYAWGAVGSIAGTFFAGFLLIAWMGTAATIFTVAGLLAMMGLIYGYRSWLPYAVTAAYGAALLCTFGPWSSTRAMGETLGLRQKFDPDVVFFDESQYQLVRVKVGVGDRDERVMLLDKLIHSKGNLRDPLDLKYEYEWVYAEVMRRHHPDSQPLAGLVIGGGGFSFPRFLEKRYPGSRVEVAEIDPSVTEAAHAAFGLPRDTAIKIYNMDARNRVEDLVRQRAAGEAVAGFDFIFGDSISDFSVPYHLTTLEFNRQLSELLTDRGIYMLNMIDMLRPGRFLGAVVNTCREVFPHVVVFKTNPVDDDRDTFIVISSKRPLELSGIVEAIQSKYPFAGRMLSSGDLAALTQRSEGLVLTDDYAPVENLLTSVVRIFRAEWNDKASAFLEEVLRLIDADKLDQAEARCRKMIQEQPATAKAHLYLGVVLSKRGLFGDAIAHYRDALRLDANDPKAHANLGMALAQTGDAEAALQCYRIALKIEPTDVTTRNQLATALAKLDRLDEAISEFRQSIAIRPGLAEAHFNLGALLTRKGDFAAAASEFTETLKLRPDHSEARRALGMALLESGKAADAVPHFREVLKSEPGRADIHDQLGQALAQIEDFTAAAEAFSKAVELGPLNADFRQNLGLALQLTKRPSEAIVQYQESLRLQPGNAAVANALARILAATPEDRLRDCAEAIRWAEHLGTLVEGDNPEALDTLAIAYACSSKYQEALNIGRRALEAATAQGQTELAGQIKARISLYEAGKPYLE